MAYIFYEFHRYLEFMGRPSKCGNFFCPKVSISKIRRLIIADQPNGKTELQHELHKFSASIAFLKMVYELFPLGM